MDVTIKNACGLNSQNVELDCPSKLTFRTRSYADALYFKALFANITEEQHDAALRQSVREGQEAA